MPGAKYEFPFLPVSFYKQEYELTEIRENIEMFLYGVISVSLPFVLGHPQFLVGSAVNCALVLAAFNLKGKRLLPLIVLPAIGAYLAGYLFGTATSALLYLIPFIWVGNAILVYSIKEWVLNKKMNRVAALVGGSIAKAAFLFTVAFILYSLALIPAAFLTAMGILQLTTALAGGAAALVLQEGKKRFVAS